MGQAAVSPAGLVRVTVASSTRRVDLALPGAVPVAELLPDLARSVGLLDPDTAHGGHRLVTHDGRELAAAAGLSAQGVEDGGLLLVSAGACEDARPAYDDVVEAVADVVERDLDPWDPGAGRRTALVAAGLLAALGALATLTLRGSPGAGLAAGLVAVALLAAAVVLSRVGRQRRLAVGIVWSAALYAAAGGFVLAPGGPPCGLPLAVAAGGALLCGLLALVGVAEGRPLLLPPVAVGALGLVAGLVVHATRLDPAVVLTTALAIVVVLTTLLPWLAVAAVGSGSGVHVGSAGIVLAEVAADVRLGHQILVSLGATVGLLLVLVAPFAVSLGPSGTLLALAASCVVALRTRHHAAGAEVLTGLVSAGLGLVSVAAAALWLHPDWRPVVVGALTFAAAALLAGALTSGRPSAHRARLADVVESGSLLALPPLLVVASGLFSVVRS